jgi:hypothetical protein
MANSNADNNLKSLILQYRKLMACRYTTQNNFQLQIKLFKLLSALELAIRKIDAVVNKYSFYLRMILVF